MPRIAVVTGGNKGIGNAIVKALCLQNPDWKVYLTARDEGRGKEAVEEMKKVAGCSPNFCQLDIDSKESIEKAKTYFQNTYGGVDVLVNNAGIAYKGSSTAPFSEQAEVSVGTNFFGTMNVCNAFGPILKPGARLVIVSSFVSQMSLAKCSQSLKTSFTSDTLTMEQLVALMNKFVSDVKAGSHESEGWPSSGYGMSKVGTTCLARVLQREFNKDSRKDLVANAVCPGYVATDMSSHKGHLTVEQGAETPVYAACLPPNTPIKGEFLREKKVAEW